MKKKTLVFVLSIMFCMIPFSQVDAKENNFYSLNSIISSATKFESLKPDIHDSLQMVLPEKCPERKIIKEITLDEEQQEKIKLINNFVFSRAKKADYEDYSSDWGYKDMAMRSNGLERQKLYQQIESCEKRYHTDLQNIENIEGIGGVVATIDSAKERLSVNEIVETYYTFKNDHPMCYWLSNTLKVSGNLVLITCEDEYLSGDVRSEKNAVIQNQIEQYITLTKGKTTNYDKALTIHDAIIKEIDYAYNSEGQPEDKPWAHSILGVFENKSAVCEGYAKAYQLLLTAAGVENIYITGQGNGEDHAWNLVKMDDGAYYYTDVTWDDQPAYPEGKTEYYFNLPANDFEAEHIANTPEQCGEYFLYALPEASKKKDYTYYQKMDALINSDNVKEASDSLDAYIKAGITASDNEKNVIRMKVDGADFEKVINVLGLIYFNPMDGSERWALNSALQEIKNSAGVCIGGGKVQVEWDEGRQLVYITLGEQPYIVELFTDGISVGKYKSFDAAVESITDHSKSHVLQILELDLSAPLEIPEGNNFTIKGRRDELDDGISRVSILSFVKDLKLKNDIKIGDLVLAELLPGGMNEICVEQSNMSILKNSFVEISGITLIGAGLGSLEVPENTYCGFRGDFLKNISINLDGGQTSFFDTNGTIDWVKGTGETLPTISVNDGCNLKIGTIDLSKSHIHFSLFSTINFNPPSVTVDKVISDNEKKFFLCFSSGYEGSKLSKFAITGNCEAKIDVQIQPEQELWKYGDMKLLTAPSLSEDKLYVYTSNWENVPFYKNNDGEFIIKQKNNDMGKIERISRNKTFLNSFYYPGEKFNPIDGELLIDYKDGSQKTVSVNEFMCSGYDMNKIGKQQVLVTYCGLTTTFDIYVIKPYTNLEMIKNPDKMEYYIGEEFDPTGGVIRITYEDGSTEDIDLVPGMSQDNSSPETIGNHLMIIKFPTIFFDFNVLYKEIEIQNISLDKTSLTLTIGEIETLKAMITPENATNKNITWLSDKPEIASVDQEGKVTANQRGTTTITATVDNGQKYAACIVTVNELEWILGDVNNDKSINASDALLTLRHAVKEIILQDNQFKCADITKDSVINASDALQILRYSVKEIDTF